MILKSRQRVVDQWNTRWPIGQRVSVKAQKGEIVYTRTRSRAFLVAGTWPGVFVDGFQAAYSLHDVAPEAPAVAENVHAG